MASQKSLLREGHAPSPAESKAITPPALTPISRARESAQIPRLHPVRGASRAGVQARAPRGARDRSEFPAHPCGAGPPDLPAAVRKKRVATRACRLRRAIIATGFRNNNSKRFPPGKKNLFGLEGAAPMLRSLGRQAIAFGIAAVAACGAALAQSQSQRQDELSAPQPGQAPMMNAPVQPVSPLPAAPVQAPTITNNPDYPRQPIFVPTPVVTPQLQQQPQSRQQQSPAQPRTSASEQRGRGAFTAPGVTREVTNERNEFQDFIWASTGQVLPLYGQNLFEAPSTFAPVENVP